MENLDILKKLSPDLQWLVDELLQTQTVKIQTPYYKYDYIKVTIWLTELSEFIMTRCVTKLDDSVIDEKIDKILNLIYPMVDTQKYSMEKIRNNIKLLF